MGRARTPKMVTVGEIAILGEGTWGRGTFKGNYKKTEKVGTLPEPLRKQPKGDKQTQQSLYLPMNNTTPGWVRLSGPRTLAEEKRNPAIGHIAAG